jgi:hypothetical protein
MDSTPESHPTRNAGNRRRRVIVNPALQAAIIRRIALFPALCLCVCVIVVCAFAKRLADEATAADINLPSTLPLLAAMLTFLLLSCVAIVYGALRFSHAIAGPSYRLVISLDRLARGERGFRVKLREDDYLPEIAEAMNRMIEAIEAKEAASTSSVATPPQPARVANRVTAPTA